MPLNVKIRTDLVAHGSLLHKFKNTYHFGSSWIPDFQFQNTDWFAGGLWIPDSQFQNTERFGGPWIPTCPFPKFGLIWPSVEPPSFYENSDQISGPCIPFQNYFTVNFMRDSGSISLSSGKVYSGNFAPHQVLLLFEKQLEQRTTRNQLGFHHILVILYFESRKDPNCV